MVVLRVVLAWSLVVLLRLRVDWSEKEPFEVVVTGVVFNLSREQATIAGALYDSVHSIKQLSCSPSQGEVYGSRSRRDACPSYPSGL